MPTDPTAAEQQLKTLLTELLQLDDAARLDFGIYKILALRREELSRFLDTLAGEVRAELLASGARSHEAAKAAVAEFVSGSLKLGMTYDEIYGSSRHKTLTEQLAGAIEPGQLAQEVFESLVTFFARYWDEGDFIAAPRYSRDQYAIPYDGSEVALHWANRDQYYVKSSLFLNDMVVKEPHFPGRLLLGRPGLRGLSCQLPGGDGQLDADLPDLAELRRAGRARRRGELERQRELQQRRPRRSGTGW